MPPSTSWSMSVQARPRRSMWRTAPTPSSGPPASTGSTRSITSAITPPTEPAVPLTSPPPVKAAGSTTGIWIWICLMLTSSPTPSPQRNSDFHTCFSDTKKPRSLRSGVFLRSDSTPSGAGLVPALFLSCRSLQMPRPAVFNGIFSGAVPSLFIHIVFLTFLPHSGRICIDNGKTKCYSID